MLLFLVFDWFLVKILFFSQLKGRLKAVTELVKRRIRLGNRKFQKEYRGMTINFQTVHDQLSELEKIVSADKIWGSFWNYWHPSPLVFWPLDGIKNLAHSKVKREDWTDKNREKNRSAVSKHGDRSASGLWLTAGANCTHLIKQSMTASSHKAIVLPKKITDPDPTSARYPSLNYPRSRIELASVLAIIT